MHCPACKNIGLVPVTLELELPASNCPKCGGNWIASTQYWTWLEKHISHESNFTVGRGVPAEPDCGSTAHRDGSPCLALPITVSDSKGAKLCPECGVILIRRQAGHELGFGLEQCGRCNGFWLDQNEWEALKAHDLHDALHVILSGEWQNQERRKEYERKQEGRQQATREEYERKLQEHYAQRFGPEIYAEAVRIREWLRKQPHRLALLAFLCDGDPHRGQREQAKLVRHDQPRSE